MKSIAMTYALEAKINFLFEKQSEPYRQYGEVSIAEEKLILDQEHLWDFWFHQKTERCGA
ncbi:MAG: hypothetical protein AAB914_03685 [Patescibacteria group bacterium]